MKKQMGIATVALLALTAVCAGLTYGMKSEVCYALAITFGTAFYHFAMRLAVGTAVNKMKGNRFDYRSKWFQELPFEKGLYARLRVKSWKEKIPTFSPEQFDLRKHGVEGIVMATCQAEVVHELIMVLSFVPVLFSPGLGNWGYL